MKLIQLMALWKMNIIPAYSIIHIMIFATALILAVIFTMLFKNTGSGKLYLAVGIFLVITEVLKQLLLTYICGSYSWSDFPFQLCSVPMYLCIIYFFKPSPLIDDFLMLFATIGALVAFIEPTSSFTGYVWLTIHSLLWHTILLFLGFRRIYKFVKEEKNVSIRRFCRPAAAYLCLAFTAVGINAVFFKISKGTCNMFFLGPGYPNAVILNNIYERSGWVTTTAAMIITTLLCGFLLYLSLYGYKTCHKSRIPQEK